MTVQKTPAAGWRKSSRSNGTGGNNCVEVRVQSDVVDVRDSKHPDGPVLTFTPAEWDAFVAGVRAGEFDRPRRPPNWF